MPITMEDYLSRIDEAKKRMEKEDIDLLLMYGDGLRDGDLRYFTGCPVIGVPHIDYGIPYGSFAMFAIPLKEEPTLFIVDFFVPSVREEIGSIPSLTDEPWFKVEAWSKSISILKELKGKAGLKKIAFTGKDIAPYPVYTAFENALGEMKDTDITERMRIIKSDKEIKLLEKAANITDRVYVELTENIIKEGKTERDIAREIMISALSMGAEEVWLPVLVMSGPYEETRLGKARDVPVKKGELLQTHICPRYQHYCCDCDRGIGFGKITKEQEDLLERVKEAHRIGRETIKPGIKGSEALEAMTAFHESMGVLPGLVYGHGIGIQFEEIGFIDDWTLEAGMTFTFAAGAYEKGVGAVRVEDACLVTKTGGRCLNNFERAPIIK